MVKLTADQQEMLVHAEPEVFVPVKGAWGRRGCTNVRLEAAKRPIVRSALALACGNATSKASRPALRGK